MRSSRRGAVDPFIVMDVMEAARAAEESGRHIIHMEVGQPGTAAPEAARRALMRSMSESPLGYTVALGLPELRARIARLYGDWYGLDVDPGRVVVTPGASGAFILAFSALFDAGGRVVIGAPSYPSYRHIMRAMDLEVIEITTRAADRYMLRPDDLAGRGFEGVMIASPANPTGTMLDRATLGELVAGTQEAGAAFISDEIYHGIEYDKTAVSALEISDDVCVVNSFSKYFSMTGWRAGWLILPEPNLRQVERLAQNMFICASHAAQVTALAAMDATDELDANLAVYRRNRRLMIEGLAAAGFRDIAPPDGAFYIYADVSAFTNDSRAFAARILEQAGVAVTPGLDFDASRGHEFLRFSYARKTEEIEEGLSRLKRFMIDEGLSERT